MLAFEQTRERLFACLDDNTIAHPLPELGLCCPKLFPILADDKCCLFLPFLLRAHANTPRPLRIVDTHRTPWGSLSCEAASNFQTTKTEFPAPVATTLLRNRRVCNSALRIEVSGRSRILS